MATIKQRAKKFAEEFRKAMKVEFNHYAKSNRWIFVLLPECGFYHLEDERGFEICWLCFCLEITNK